MVLLSAKLFVHSCKKHHSSYSHNKNTQDSFDTNSKTTFPSYIIHSKQIIKHIFHLLSSGTMKTLEYSLSGKKMCWESAVCSYELRFYYLWCWSRPSWRRVAPGGSWAALSWRSWDLYGGAAGRPSTGPVWVANTWPKVANRDIKCHLLVNLIPQGAKIIWKLHNGPRTTTNQTQLELWSYFPLHGRRSIFK